MCREYNTDPDGYLFIYR